MPNRIIKEGICTSDSIDSLSWFEEVLFYRLIVNCDDYGRFDGRIPVIKNRLFPLKEDLTTKTVRSGLTKLVNAGLVALYAFEGKPFLYLPTWNDHQNVRAKRSRYPAPEEGVNASESICNQMNADAPDIRIQSESVSESESNAYGAPDAPVGRSARGRFSPPTVEQVRQYCRSRGNCVDPQRFVDYYSANGWRVGKNPMKDWQAAVRTWEKKDGENRTRGSSNPFLEMLAEEAYE